MSPLLPSCRRQGGPAGSGLRGPMAWGFAASPLPPPHPSCSRKRGGPAGSSLRGPAAGALAPPLLPPLLPSCSVRDLAGSPASPLPSQSPLSALSWLGLLWGWRRRAASGGSRTGLLRSETECGDARGGRRGGGLPRAMAEAACGDARGGRRGGGLPRADAGAACGWRCFAGVGQARVSTRCSGGDAGDTPALACRRWGGGCPAVVMVAPTALEGRCFLPIRRCTSPSE